MQHNTHRVSNTISNQYQQQSTQTSQSAVHRSASAKRCSHVCTVPHGCFHTYLLSSLAVLCMCVVRVRVLRMPFPIEGLFCDWPQSNSFKRNCKKVSLVR